MKKAHKYQSSWTFVTVVVEKKKEKLKTIRLTTPNFFQPVTRNTYFFLGLNKFFPNQMPVHSYCLNLFNYILYDLNILRFFIPHTNYFFFFTIILDFIINFTVYCMCSAKTSVSNYAVRAINLLLPAINLQAVVCINSNASCINM